MNRRVWEVVVVLGIIIVLLAWMGQAAPLDALLNLAFGWVFYLFRVIPEVSVNVSVVLTAFICLAGLTVGLHLFLGWLFRHPSTSRTEDAVRRWPLRWTGMILGVVLLMFVAGTAAVGVVHQTGWLITSPEPLMEGSWHLATRMSSANNLKQFVIAMHNYADQNGGRFPPAAVCGRDGQPLLSWRVLLLPYLEEEKLFQEFRLDEPWDSPHNLRLVPRMPKLYALPQRGQGRPHVTHYQVFTGKGAAFEGPQGLRLPDDFPDGLNNTIFIVEAAEPVPWTKPQDLSYAPDKPLPRLLQRPKMGPLVVLADGAARTAKADMSEPTLRALITRNGGEEVSDDW
jgi:hypothetical protein